MPCPSLESGFAIDRPPERVQKAPNIKFSIFVGKMLYRNCRPDQNPKNMEHQCKIHAKNLMPSSQNIINFIEDRKPGKISRGEILFRGMHKNWKKLGNCLLKCGKRLGLALFSFGHPRTSGPKKSCAPPAKSLPQIPWRTER